MYRYAGRYSEARDIFQGIRTLLPTREIADLALAGVAMNEGKLSEAERFCRRALELNSASAAVYAQLGEIQLLQNKLADARRTLQRSSEMSQNGPVGDLAKCLLKVISMTSRKDG